VSELEREALRLCDRYLREVVLAFGLCPWAEPALAAGRVGKLVNLMDDGALIATRSQPSDELRQGIDGFIASDAEIGLVVFPRLTVGRAAFDAFAERVRRDERARRPAGVRPPFLVAAFHPDGDAAFTDPPRLISFLRRTPDAMLQFVRADSIDRTHAGWPSVATDIANQNWNSLAPDQGAKLAETVRAIRADRDATYRHLAATRI